MAFEGPDSKFASKRDTWLVVLLWASNLLVLAAAVVAWESPSSPVFHLLYSLAMVAVIGLVFWILYGTHYTLKAEEIRIRSGPFVWRVPYEAIQRVERSRSILSGPSTSLDRLVIRYDGSTWGVLISPEDQEGFKTELVLRAPDLTRLGDAVVRR